MAKELRNYERKIWRFDQIAKNVNERVEPGDVDVDHYVGLEHLDPDSLKIRRWGMPADVESSKLLFKKGDIIFGKRRVYQRKLGVAEFDGICSAHAMVLRPKTDVVLPEFLPFFLQSDLFMNRALEISVGSLSPTINWKTLAKQEFALPPLEEQRRIAKLLVAADSMIEARIVAVEKLRTLKLSYLREKYSSFLREFGNVTLGKVGAWTSGGTPSKKNKTYWEGGKIPWITPKDVKSLTIEDTQDHVTEAALENAKSVLFNSESFVVVWRSGILRHSLPIAKVKSDFTINQDMKVFKPASNEINSDYVRYFLEAFTDEIRLKCVKSGTTVESIDTSAFFSYPIPLPTIALQNELLTVAAQFDGAIAKAQHSNEKDKLVKAGTLDLIN